MSSQEIYKIIMLFYKLLFQVPKQESCPESTLCLLFWVNNHPGNESQPGWDCIGEDKDPGKLSGELVEMNNKCMFI